MTLSDEVVRFFEKQGGVLVCTLDDRKRIHCSVKGIVKIGDEGKLFLIDLYLYKTFRNLKKNPAISITAVDEHHFKGYTLQGKAKIIPREEIKKEILEEWERRVVHRISKRVIKSVQTGAKSKRHFEADLPTRPKYAIEVKIDNVIDLSPPNLWAKK
jgi:uncharacterized pyridoxamine 5'-phosphate oxidase family protein